MQGSVLLPPSRTRIIAEMACAHEGNIDQVRKLIDIAAESGADIVQFQVFDTNKVFSPYYFNFELMQKLEIKPEEWRLAFKHAQQYDMEIWSTIFDEGSLELSLESGANVIKLHSTDISNMALLEKVGKTGLPVSLSAGGSTLNEISNAVQCVRNAGCERLILMHGYQDYPTDPLESRLRYMQTLKRMFACEIGYMDHTDGGEELAMILPLIAVGAGVDYIEKHYTDDRSLKGIDYESSVDPADLKKLVNLIRTADKALGNGSFVEMSEGEKRYRTNMKKVVVAARDIQPGEVISGDDIAFMRGEGTGLSPAEANLVIGKQAKEPLARYRNIYLNQLQ